MNRKWIIAVSSAAVYGAAALYVILQIAADGFIQSRRSVVLDILKKATGLSVHIDTLSYAFPDGVRICGLSSSTDDGAPLFQVADIKIALKVGRLLSGHPLSLQIVKVIKAKDAEVHLRRGEKGWRPPSLKDERTTSEEGWMNEEGHLVVEIHNLVINGETERGAIRREYQRLLWEGDHRFRKGMLTVIGEGEILTASFHDGIGNGRRGAIEAKSFRLSFLSVFLGNILPFERLQLSGKADWSSGPPGVVSWNAEVCLSEEEVSEEFACLVKVSGVSDSDAGGVNAAGRITIGGEICHYRISFRHACHQPLTVELSFPDFSFASLVARIPPAFRPHLPDLKVKGRFQGTFWASLALKPPYRIEYGYRGRYDPLTVLSLGPKIHPEKLQQPFTHTARLPNGDKITIWVGPENPDFIPIEAVPVSMIRAILAAEDGGFFYHRGFAIGPIIESSVENYRAGRVLRGASTVTMQLAKNLYLGAERTLSRKFEELFVTAALEQYLTKRRIMEIYLNIIEWGDKIYGLGPAARYYFQKDARNLTDEECAFLASIIARPLDGWKTDPLPSLSDGWRQYVALLLRNMPEKRIPQGW